MGKSSILLGGVLFLFACQPPSGQTPVVKSSVVSSSSVVSPQSSASGSPEPTSSATPIESPSPTPAFSSLPVEIIAGTGAKGFQDGPAKLATFSSLQGLCVHPTSGDIYILDTHKIRKLSPDGQVSTVAGSEEAGFQDGSLQEARFNWPGSCDIDVKGNMFINDLRNFRIRQISNDNKVSTVLGNGEAASKDGNLSEARLYYAENMVITSTGKMYFTESYKIRVFFEGKLTTLNAHQLSGDGRQTYRNGPIQTEATFGSGLNLTKNLKDEIFVSDVGIRAIRKIALDNTVTTFSQEKWDSEWSFFSTPGDIVYSPKADKFFISEFLNVYKMDNQGNVSMVAGNRLAFDQNKPLPFGSIKKMVVVADHIYLADSGSNQIKRMRIED